MAPVHRTPVKPRAAAGVTPKMPAGTAKHRRPTAANTAARYPVEHSNSGKKVSIRFDSAI